MAAALVLGRLLLAAVFTVAAVAKLRDLPASRRAVAGFGIPARQAALVGTVLPVAELAIAGGLVAEPTYAVAALAAIVLLAAFCVAIGANLVRGRAPECNCFGQLHSAPVGRSALARNAALAALAAGIAAADPAVPVAVIAGGLALVVVPVVVAWRRDPARARPGEPEGLALGTRAPRFRIPANGRPEVSLDSLLSRRLPVLLLFTDRECGPCIELKPDVERWRGDLRDEVEIAVLENAGDVAAAYRTLGTPTALLVGADGLVASAPAGGRARIEKLIADTVEGFEPRSERSAGLRRREVFVRAGTAWAATSLVLGWPVRAAIDLRAGDRPCPKPWQIRCGGECISSLMDERNCGTKCENLRRCENSTFRHDVCSGGRCIPDGDGSRCAVARGSDAPPARQCPGGMICCQGNCVDPNRTGNCGGCGSTAGSAGRRPACCQGLPRDVANDARHCGACFNRCPPDKPYCYAPPGTAANEGCREECGRGLDACGRRCYRPRTEMCCGGRIYVKASLPENAECCGGEIEIRPPGAWFCP
jgi:uncharacterized membrane protein YphA (DoxX/SURF4 family)